MNDNQRYEILKDKTLTAPLYDHTKRKHIDTDGMDKRSKSDNGEAGKKPGEQFGVCKVQSIKPTERWSMPIAW